MSSKEMTDFQKQFFSKGTGGTLFTQKEFDDALAMAKAELIAHAIEATKQALVIEREACAKVAYDLENELYGSKEEESEPKGEIAKAILNRIPSQRN